MAFETFLARNIQFNNLEDCMFFLSNVIKEKRHLDDGFLIPITRKQLLKHLKKLFPNYKKEYNDFLNDYIHNLSQSDITRIYYKNNIFKFSKLRKIRNMLSDVIEQIDTFKNPNDVPKNVIDELNIIWGFYKEFVFFNQSPYNRIHRLKFHKRKAVVASDTDSTMVYIDKWVIFIRKAIINVNDKLIHKDKDELRFISINLLVFLLTNMIKGVLNKYTKSVNIPKRFRYKINMKNEFLFSRIILTKKKKRYITSNGLRDGKVLYPEKIDFKGIDFVKSTTGEATEKFLKNLIKEKLLYTKEINISDVLKELEKLEQMIISSLEAGEKYFLTPKSVKELDAYKDPLREMGVRSVITWNYLYPNNTIELPEFIDIVKVSFNEEKIEQLKYKVPEIYESIHKNILNSHEKKIQDKGLIVIGIPRNIPTIPEWIIPFIDYTAIVNSNISTFHSVLESLGIAIIKTTDNNYFSNILQI